MPDGSFSTDTGDLGILAIQVFALTEGRGGFGQLQWICDGLPSEKEALSGMAELN